MELEEEREIMLKYGRMGRNLTIICAVFMYSGGIIYHTILQYAIGSYVDEHNCTIKPLVYPTYSALYNVQRKPIYELVYVTHCMCSYVMDSITVGACGLAALFVTHACGQIDIIISRLNDLVRDEYIKNTFNLNAQLIKIIEHHLRILRYNNELEIKKFPLCDETENET